MIRKLKNTSKPIRQYGYVITIPGECAIEAALSISAAAEKLDIQPDSIGEGKEFEAYPCDKDIVDYFRLIGAKPIRWTDISFTQNNIATFRYSSGRENGKLIAHNMNLHPHAFCRIETLANGSMVGFVDVLVDFYIAHNRKLMTSGN